MTGARTSRAPCGPPSESAAPTTSPSSSTARWSSLLRSRRKARRCSSRSTWAWARAELARSATAPRRREEAKRVAEQTRLSLDVGSQFRQLIARRVREATVSSEPVPGTPPWSELKERDPAGLILSGGPLSVYEEGPPQVDPEALRAGVPVLGICYGMQLIAHHLGGKVDPGQAREYGPALLAVREPNGLFKGLNSELPVWMSHGDHVSQLPPGFHSLASSGNSPVAAFANDHGIFGIQFHPEVVHTPSGREVLRNFLYGVCQCDASWTPGSFVAEATESIRAQVGSGRVICALSGGVDSAVAATLVHRAIGDELTCVFVNNGLLRKEEPERV